METLNALEEVFSPAVLQSDKGEGTNLYIELQGKFQARVFTLPYSEWNMM